MTRKFLIPQQPTKRNGFRGGVGSDITKQTKASMEVLRATFAPFV
jgi:hypothetical protein